MEVSVLRIRDSRYLSLVGWVGKLAETRSDFRSESVHIRVGIETY
jgi:hypothetical protein